MDDTTNQMLQAYLYGKAVGYATGLIVLALIAVYLIVEILIRTAVALLRGLWHRVFPTEEDRRVLQQLHQEVLAQRQAVKDLMRAEWMAGQADEREKVQARRAERQARHAQSDAERQQWEAKRQQWEAGHQQWHAIGKELKAHWKADEEEMKAQWKAEHKARAAEGDWLLRVEWEAEHQVWEAKRQQWEAKRRELEALWGPQRQELEAQRKAEQEAKRQGLEAQGKAEQEAKRQGLEAQRRARSLERAAYYAALHAARPPFRLQLRATIPMLFHPRRERDLWRGYCLAVRHPLAVDVQAAYRRLLEQRLSPSQPPTGAAAAGTGAGD